MRPPRDAPRVADYLRMLARWWLVVVGATVLCAGAAYGQAWLREPGYVATVQLFTVVPGDAGVRAAYEGGRAAAARTPSYATLATSQTVLARTLDDVGASMSPAQLAEDVSVVNAPQSSLLTIDVVGDDERDAVDKANALARNMVAVSQEVDWTPDGVQSELAVIDLATSARSDSDDRIGDLVTGAGLGFLLSTLVVLGYEIRRDRVLGSRQVARLVSFVGGRHAAEPRS